MSKAYVFDIIIANLSFIDFINKVKNNNGGAVMITKDMSITDIVNQYPKTPDVFRRFGMSCFG